MGREARPGVCRPPLALLHTALSPPGLWMLSPVLSPLLPCTSKRLAASLSSTPPERCLLPG